MDDVIERLDDRLLEYVALPRRTRDQVFISYSHKDQEWLDRLLTMLKPLTRTNKVSVWADPKIKAGAKWKEEIEQAS